MVTAKVLLMEHTEEEKAFSSMLGNAENIGVRMLKVVNFDELIWKGCTYCFKILKESDLLTNFVVLINGKRGQKVMNFFIYYRKN